MTEDNKEKIVLPHIRTSRRRVVANSDRKRALFSCDRCKLKKIGCQRVGDEGLQHDSQTPCKECKKLDLECKTTIRRKKRVHGPIESIGLHYKCLLIILQGLYPEIDTNSIDSLIDLGISLNLKMPSRDGIVNEDEDKELKDIAILLTSGRKRPKVKIDVDLTDPSPLSQANSADSPAVEEQKPRPVVKAADDRVIFDQGGNSHYIGPLGAPAMASTLFTLISRSTSKKDSLQSVSRLQKNAPKKEGVINSKQTPMDSYFLKSLDVDKYPLINGIKRKEADFYIQTFFTMIHPLIYCFDELDFRNNYDAFWAILQKSSKSKNGSKFKVSNAQVCCIYMIWILARQFVTAQVTHETLELDDYLMGKYLDIIRVSLSEMLLTPSLDGIRCMILLSIYMDNNKKRESGYILIETAARQAISLGLNRKSLLLHTKKVTKSEELKRTWWVLFKHELRFSNQMGRATCLQIEDVNLDNPIIPSDPAFESFIAEEIKLNRIMYSLLQYRKKLYLNNELLSLTNMEKAINLKKMFNQWLRELPAQLLDYENNPTYYKCHLHLEYHYYFISLSLPFLIYFSIHNNNLKLSNDEPILDLICQCVKSSIAIAQVITFVDNNGFFNGTIQLDLFYCYHASMSLVLFYLLVHKTNAFDLKFIQSQYGLSVATLSDSLKMIRMMNLKNSDAISGTLETISELIETMIYDAEVIVQSDSPISRPYPNSPVLSKNQPAQKVDTNISLSKGGQYEGDTRSFTGDAAPLTPAAIQNTISDAQGPTALAHQNAYEMDNFSFAIDNQMVLDNDMMDMLFGNDIFGIYNQQDQDPGNLRH